MSFSRKLVIGSWVCLAMVGIGAAISNRTPLLRAFLQTNLDGNSHSITNLATESANTVWAGPTTGSAASPAFRALVSADIPALSYDALNAAHDATNGLGSAAFKATSFFDLANAAHDATNGLLSAAFHAASDFALSSRTITVNGTANQISSSAGAQDLSSDRTWTLSVPTAPIFTNLFNSGDQYKTNGAISSNDYDIMASNNLGSFSASSGLGNFTASSGAAFKTPTNTPAVGQIPIATATDGSTAWTTYNHGSQTMGSAVNAQSLTSGASTNFYYMQGQSGGASTFNTYPCGIDGNIIEFRVFYAANIAATTNITFDIYTNDFTGTVAAKATSFRAIVAAGSHFNAVTNTIPIKAGYGFVVAVSQSAGTGMPSSSYAWSVRLSW